MPRIHPVLWTRLKNHLDLSQSALYARIQRVAIDHAVGNDIAALELARSLNIGFQRYATPSQLADLRTLRQGGAPSSSRPAPAAPAAAPARARRAVGRSIPKTKENTVFVVHGRDNQLRDSMYQLLGALGLRVHEWGHAIKAARGGSNPYVNDVVTDIMERSQAIVVLLSPDDEAVLKKQFVGRKERSAEGKLRGQARPNVIFETGIAIGAHHRKTLIVQVGDVKRFTDIGGMHILHLSNKDSSRNDFVTRLKKLGCKADTTGDLWLRAGDFVPTVPAARRRKS